MIVKNNIAFLFEEDAPFLERFFRKIFKYSKFIPPTFISKQKMKQFKLVYWVAPNDRLILMFDLMFMFDKNSPYRMDRALSLTDSRFILLKNEVFDYSKVIFQDDTNFCKGCGKGYHIQTVKKEDIVWGDRYSETIIPSYKCACGNIIPFMYGSEILGFK